MKDFIKYNIKQIMCHVLYHAGYFDRQLGKIKDRAVILMYHSINENRHRIGVNKESFERQMEYIKEKMNPVPLITIAHWISKGKSIPPRAVAVSFDDGYEDNFIMAYPILKKFSIPATIFLTTGHIESTKIFWWDKVSEIIKKTNKPFVDLKDFQSFRNSSTNSPELIKLNTFSRKVDAIMTIIKFFKTFEYHRIHEATDLLQKILDVGDKDIEPSSMLNWRQIKEMKRNGIDFGAHTVTHPDLTKIAQDEAVKEIKSSKDTIEQKIDATIYGFAYPYGLKDHFNEKITKIIKNAGFHYTCSAEPGIVTKGNDAYDLKRISMNSNSLPLAVWKIYKSIKYSTDEKG
jgi:peptidoglycan/xylan/chitin deacetylase (PgdA/CDA1 family)